MSFETQSLFTAFDSDYFEYSSQPIFEATLFTPELVPDQSIVLLDVHFGTFRLFQFFAFNFQQETIFEFQMIAMKSSHFCGFLLITVWKFR
jgi:hypothetical protein